MRQWAVYACITEISQTIAQLPLKLKRPAPGGGTEDATDHPLYDLVKTLPNPQMTSFNFREAQQAHLLTGGNNYSFIERNRLGVKYIWPITNCTPRKANGREINEMRLSKSDRIVYDVDTVDGKRTYSSRDILHIVGFSWNGLIGNSVITDFAKDLIGTAMTLDQFQAKAMKNGYYPSGVLEHPDKLGDAKESFISALDQRYAGPENVRRPMILENGMKWNTTSVSMVDKELINQLQMSGTQICGVFKVPPHRIGIFEKNTNYNNTEQGNKSFLDGCIQQWVVRWEQAMNWKLLTAQERQEGYFFNFNFGGLLRPDAKTRSEIQWREWQTGVPLNEIRMKNDENPIEGGDTSFVPVNMVPIEMAGMNIKQPTEPTADPNKIPGSEPDKRGLLLDDDLVSLRTLERNAVTRELTKQQNGKSVRSLDDFLDEFYGKLYDKIENRTRLIIQCFNGPEETDQALVEIRQEFEDRCNRLKSGEEVWNEQD